MVRPGVVCQCPVFSMLDAESLDLVASARRTRAVRRGALVFRDGDPCDAMFAVLKGSVRVYTVARDGRERTLHTVRPPHSFAEAALFSDGGYPACAAALSPTVLLVVPKSALLHVLVERPASGLGLFRSLSQWLHRLLDELEVETFLSTRARVAAWLLREADGQPRARRRVTLSQPRKEIASQLGMVPETLSRIQAELAERGLIRAARRHVDILDREGLRDLILSRS
jgi:CRP/FNR family transcriptional regulator, dissimilatory nitrate respiration regulator